MLRELYIERKSLSPQHLDAYAKSVADGYVCTKLNMRATGWMPRTMIDLRYIQQKLPVDCAQESFCKTSYKDGCVYWLPARYISNWVGQCGFMVGLVYIFPDLVIPATKCETLAALSVCDIVMFGNRHKATT